MQNIEDLTAFVARFKELEAQSAQYGEQKVANAGLESLVDQAKNSVTEAHTQLHELQARYETQEIEIAELQNELTSAKNDAAAAHQKLDQETLNLQLAQRAHEHTQTKVRNLQTENNQLLHRLSKVEAERGTAKLTAMEASLKAMEAEKQEMHEKIRSLEGAVQVEKGKLYDYKRKIRNLSLDA